MIWSTKRKSWYGYHGKNTFKCDHHKWDEEKKEQEKKRTRKTEEQTNKRNGRTWRRHFYSLHCSIYIQNSNYNQTKRQKYKYSITWNLSLIKNRRKKKEILNSVLIHRLSIELLKTLCFFSKLFSMLITCNWWEFRNNLFSAKLLNMKKSYKFVEFYFSSSFVQ